MVYLEFLKTCVCFAELSLTQLPASFGGNGGCIPFNLYFLPIGGARGASDVGACACCADATTFFPLSAFLGFAFCAYVAPPMEIAI